MNTGIGRSISSYFQRNAEAVFRAFEGENAPGAGTESGIFPGIFGEIRIRGVAIIGKDSIIELDNSSNLFQG